jgi:hypothetical protein
LARKDPNNNLKSLCNNRPGVSQLTKAFFSSGSQAPAWEPGE